jgi:FkbM family methyltransferase
MILDFDNLVHKYNLSIEGVLHIGAHFGEEHSLYKKHNIKNIAYFEPLRNNFNVLKQNVNDDSLMFNIALGSEEKQIEMFVETANNGQSSSILEPELHLVQYPHITFNSKELVNMKRLDNIELNDKKYNMINIDVQGYELEVFKGAEKTLNDINYIISEVNRGPVYKDCAQIDQLDDFLKKFGFSRVETQWAGVVWGDAFYIKG